MQTNKQELSAFRLDPDTGYFRSGGVDVMAFDDFYPEGHQSGVSVIMHGRRIGANGDLRFEPTPGQWQPVPKKTERRADPAENAVFARMVYPDPDRHLTGFNPMIYPDFRFSYTVRTAGDGSGSSWTWRPTVPSRRNIGAGFPSIWSCSPAPFSVSPGSWTIKPASFPRSRTAPSRRGIPSIPSASASLCGKELF